MIDHPTPRTVPQVDRTMCQACRKRLARKACRVKSIIAIDPGEAPFIDGSLCCGCLICLPACAYDAVIV